MTDVRAALQAALGDAVTLERELGGAGKSHAFLATAADGGAVVVKVVAPLGADELFAERFPREVKFAFRLQHANIVPILAAGNAGGIAYYTMPFVEGHSLRERIAAGERLSLDEATRILRDVATALDYAHEQGTVHRDLKPENVLLSSGSAVVSDFGIAKAITLSQTIEISTESPILTSTTLTSAGSLPGTPAYTAPEQVVGGAVDPRADLYSWGVMAYELLAGGHPFADKGSAAAMIAAHLTESPPPILERNAEIAPSLAAVVMMCLEKDPERRPASASELLAAIDGEMPVAKEPTPRQAPPARPVWERETPPSPAAAVVAPRRWSTWPLVVAVAIAIVAAVLWLIVRHPPSSSPVPPPTSAARCGDRIAERVA